ncbi:MAG: DUF4177 domain-containing protein [Longimicrobiaceae bacterium]
MERTRWEYKVVRSDDLPSNWAGSIKPEDRDRLFNELGEQGWEMVNIDWVDDTVSDDFVATFKRPLDPR